MELTGVYVIIDPINLSVYNWNGEELLPCSPVRTDETFHITCFQNLKEARKVIRLSKEKRHDKATLDYDIRKLVLRHLDIEKI